VCWFFILRANRGHLQDAWTGWRGGPQLAFNLDGTSSIGGGGARVFCSRIPQQRNRRPICHRCRNEWREGLTRAALRACFEACFTLEIVRGRQVILRSI